MKLIKNFEKDQIINFGNSNLKIINLEDTCLFRDANGIAEMQIYKIEFNDEILYASDNGLLSNNLSIFDKVINNIGYRGNINISTYKKEYTMWKDMIYRCYNTNNRLYPYYGAIGVTINPKWYCFELFLYDFVNLQNYDNIRDNNKSYVIDIQSKQKNIPMSERVYAPGKISIKQYYQSDIYINIEKANMIGSNQEAGLYIDSSTIKPSTKIETAKKIYKPLSNGSYSYEAYEYTIHNPPKLTIPDNDDLGYNIIRTFNGVHYKDAPIIKPVTNKMKTMCVIIDKNK